MIFVLEWLVTKNLPPPLCNKHVSNEALGYHIVKLPDTYPVTYTFVEFLEYNKRFSLIYTLFYDT